MPMHHANTHGAQQHGTDKKTIVNATVAGHEASGAQCAPENYWRSRIERWENEGGAGGKNTGLEHHQWQLNTMFTIGHSTHPIEEFIGILKAYDIETLVDIRTIPRSRHNPQFSQETLALSLKSGGIAYRYMKNLGGLRRTKKGSPNQGWRNVSFRGYADYMQTAEFQHAVEELVALGKVSRTAIMCAEAVPWRCHRSLVGDALIVRHIPVEDIMSARKSSPHKLTKFAHVKGEQILYPPEIDEGTNEVAPAA